MLEPQHHLPCWSYATISGSRHVVGAWVRRVLSLIADHLAHVH